ncbi:MAG: putative rane protein [Peptococcaceae bacterium]|jgi:spore germination protein KC|nr:putative rane protein [Peptococcaceae bacterium]
MLKKIAVLLLLIFLTSSLAGCWNRKEITDMAIVLGTGVDWTAEGRLRLTVQIAEPGAFAGEEAAGRGEEATNWVVSAEGKTIEEAARNLAPKVPRNIFWDHCMILVIGEEMARKGTNLVTNFFLRSREPREIMWVLVAKGEAKDFLETYSDLEKTSAQAANLLTRMRTGYSVQLWELAEMLAGKGVQPVVTRVEVKEAGVTPGPGQEMKPPVHKQVEISGVGVFKEEKLIGWLDDYETRALLWLKGEPMEGVITVPDPGEPDKEVSITIRRGSTKVVPEYDGKNLRFAVKVKMEGDMVEQQSRENLAKPEMIKVLEKEMAEEIKKRAFITLEKAQKEYGVDIFGFGDAFHRKYKKAWRELKNRWDTEFAEAEVIIEAEAYVREIGLLSKRAGTPEE